MNEAKISHDGSNMKPPIKLVPTLDVQNDLVPPKIYDQIMELRVHNGSIFPWTVGETAQEVAEHGDDYCLAHKDGGIIDHEAIDTYLKSLNVNEGDTINLFIWW